jgi:nitronate monooxygenase
VTLRTPLCDALGIRVPVLLAPMAGGFTTPELVAAVTRAGGLGVFGAMGKTADALRADVARALELAGPPVGVNVQLAPPESGADARAMHAFLAPFRRELGLPPEPEAPSGPPPDPPLALVQAGLEAGATVVSSALGDPSPLVPLAREAGAPLLSMAATVEEARAHAAAGADVIVAQGAEAGGHRTTFDVGPEGPPLVGTFALVPQVVDAVDVPVVAAGGVADGRGLAAALALGAAGASLGTRFLLAEESGAPPVYRERLLALRDTDTVISDAVTGRPARWIRNRLVGALSGGDAPEHLGWGAQRAAVMDIWTAAARAGEGELVPMLAGQAAGLAGSVRPAGEIVADVVADAERVLAELVTRASAPS